MGWQQLKKESQQKNEPVVFRDDITIKIDEGGVAFTLGARDFKGVQCVAYEEGDEANHPSRTYEEGV